MTRSSSAEPSGLEAREKRFGGPPPERTPAQRWVLATAGILHELNGTSHLRVGGEPRPLCSFWSALRLREHWNVRDAEAARRCLGWLFEEGHRFDYAAELDVPWSELLGWDLVRASAVAGWAYVAYLLELDEAWGFMVRAARMLQETFGSWAEVGASYRAGRRGWSGAESREIDDLVEALTRPGGGWDLPWAVDLSGEIPAPLDPLVERVVDPDERGGQGTFRTIAEALAAHDEGLAGRIVLRPGVYDEAVRVTTALELVAEEGATIRSSDAAPLVARHNVFVRGVTFESGTDDDGEAMQAVWVGPHYVRLVDCVLRSDRCGVFAGKAKGHVVAERCRVESAKVNGFSASNGAHLVLLDCEVALAGGSALYAEGAGDVFVDGLRVRGCDGPSVAIRGENAVALTRVDVEGGASNGIELLGTAHGALVDCTVKGAGATGVLVGSTEPIHVRGGRFVESAQNDLGLMKGDVHVEESTIGGGKGCPVCVMADAELRLDGCEILGASYPLWLDGTSSTVLTNTRVGARDDFALFAKGGAAIRAFGSTFTGAKKHAVVLRGVESALFVEGAIVGAEGALHVDESARAVLRDVSVQGGLVCIQKQAEVAIVGGRIEGAGAQAVAVEAGARLALTRTSITAPNGAALTVEEARVRALGSTWTGATAEVVDAASTIDIVSDAEARALEPATLTLAPRGISALEVPASVFEPAFVTAGVKLQPSLCPIWVDLLVEDLTLDDAIELRRFGDFTVVESTSPTALAAVARAMRETFLSGTKLDAIGAKLRDRLASAEDEDDEDEDEDEDEDADEDDAAVSANSDKDASDDDDHDDEEDDDDEDDDESEDDDEGPGALDA